MSTVYEIVTEKILSKLEAGTIPWVKPWNDAKYESAHNADTGHVYTGINRLILDDGGYMTYKQITANGYKVKKGSKSHIVTFWKFFDKEDGDGNLTGEKVPMLRYYTVFSVNDIENEAGEPWTPKTFADTGKALDFEPDEYAHNIATRYIIGDGIKYREGGNGAYYMPSEHSITMPKKAHFKSVEGFYATLFHEIGHSTKTGCKRGSTSEVGKGNEEGIAELCAAYCMQFFKLSNENLIDNAADYIRGWVKVLRDDPKAIVTIASKAEKAFQYVLEIAAKTEYADISPLDIVDMPVEKAASEIIKPEVQEPKAEEDPCQGCQGGDCYNCAVFQAILAKADTRPDENPAPAAEVIPEKAVEIPEEPKAKEIPEVKAEEVKPEIVTVEIPEAQFAKAIKQLDAIKGDKKIPETFTIKADINPAGVMLSRANDKCEMLDISIPATADGFATCYFSLDALKLIKGDVTLTSDGHINGATVALLPAEKFPALYDQSANKPLKTHFITNGRYFFKDFIKAAKFTSTDMHASELTHVVNVELEKGKYNLCALDAFKLLAIDGGAEKGAAVNIPATASPVFKTWTDDNGQVMIQEFERGYMTVQFWNVKYTTKGPEIQYCDYRQMFPAEHKSRVTVHKSMLMDVLNQQIDAVKSTGEKAVATFFMDDNGIKTDIKTASFHAEKVISCEFEGEPLKISFNANLLKALLDASNLTSITIELTTPKSPAYIHEGNMTMLALPIWSREEKAA